MSNRRQRRAAAARAQAPHNVSSTPVKKASAKPNGPTSASPWVRLLSQARAAASKRHWEDAARLYRQVVTQRPDQQEALEALGLFALEQKQPAQAVDWLSRARRGAPRNARLLALLAKAQRQTGAIAQAIETYQKAVALDAQQFDVWLELGHAQFDARALEQATASAVQALALNRESAAAWHLSSQALGAAGKLPQALQAERQALARDPWLAAAHLHEGALLERSGATGAAAASYFAASTLQDVREDAQRQLERLLAATAGELGTPQDAPELTLLLALLEKPRASEPVLALARWLCEKQRLPTAIVCLEHALALQPTVATHRELAEELYVAGQRERAQLCLLRGLELERGDASTYRLLSGWLATDLKFSGSEARWQRLLAECPEDVVALVNLGAAAQRMGRPTEAAPLQQRALALAPERIEPYINLAAAWCDAGEPARAAAAHRRALALEPTRWAVHSNLLLNSHFDANVPLEQRVAEHRAFGKALAEWLGPVERRHGNRRDPERRLRIGYVSPDFNEHPVAYFLEPVLRAHDAQAFEVYCYSDVARPDATSARLAQYAAVYRPCVDDTHEALVERIARDQIDVLVDLAGHGLNNRMPVFARKPSPIQVTWLGYFDTTGLEAMDYRIADVHSVPEGAERLFVEAVARLPRSSTCFLPPASPEPAGPPCRTRGYVTFGCFSNPSKVTREVAALYGRILRGTPTSRLLLKYHTFADPGIRARFVRWFAEEGIGKERVSFQGHSPIEHYLKAFGEIDVGLDTFPYSGETTALHTLWMGVPFVALEGRSVAERLASRVLRVAQLDDWVARSADDYVRIAQSLAADPHALGTTRRRLRDHLRATPLLDHEGITRDLEASYRAMWRRWCATP